MWPSAGVNAGDLAAGIVPPAVGCVLHCVLHLRNNVGQITDLNRTLLVRHLYRYGKKTLPNTKFAISLLANYFIVHQNFEGISL